MQSSLDPTKQAYNSAGSDHWVIKKTFSVAVTEGAGVLQACRAVQSNSEERFLGLGMRLDRGTSKSGSANQVAIKSFIIIPHASCFWNFFIRLPLHFSLLCFLCLFLLLQNIFKLSSIHQGKFLSGQWPCHWGTPEEKFAFNIFVMPHCTTVLFFFCQPFCSKACRLGKQHYLWPEIGQKVRAESSYRLSQSCSDVPKPSWETSYWCNLHSTSEIPSRKEGITEARRAMVIVSEPAANLRRLNWWMTQRVCSTFFLTFLLKSSPQHPPPRDQDLLLR